MDKSVYYGVPISAGVGIGTIYIIKEKEYSINTKRISEDETEAEIKRLESAVYRTFIEIEGLSKNITGRYNQKEFDILQVYNAVLEDIFFISEIKECIINDLRTADFAINLCIEKYIGLLQNSDNEYHRQRLYDLNDIRTKLIKNVLGIDSNINGIGSSNIVVVKELLPSIATVLASKGVKGIAAYEGAGYISHSAIILRGFGIPTINNIDYDRLVKHHGHEAVINAEEGTMKISPDKSEKKRIGGMNKQGQEKSSKIIGSAATSDGCDIRVLANINNIDEFNYVRRKGIQGIGLVRTETLFMKYKEMPTEKKQFLVYSGIVKAMKGKIVNFRTVDTGSDKMPGSYLSLFSSSKLRGLDSILAVQREQFIIQIKALLRASRYGNMSITFPMVHSHTEIIKARSLIDETIEMLKNEGKKNVDGNMKIGAVIETADAVENIDGIIANSDFINIGTNDLFVEVMGFSRRNFTNEGCGFFHQKFLSVLKKCIEKINDSGKGFNVCGEMAAEPFGVMILLGMGVRDLSINSYNLPKISGVIRNISIKEAEELTNAVLACNDELCVKKLLQKWGAR